jgi:hypothetical protein
VWRGRLSLFSACARRGTLCVRACSCRLHCAGATSTHVGVPLSVISG